MLFPHAFWGTGDLFGRVPVGSKQGQFFLFYSYDLISGTPHSTARHTSQAAVQAWSSESSCFALCPACQCWAVLGA